MKVWPVILVLIGGLGYTNKDEISGFIFTSNDTAITTLTPFEAHVREEIERIDLERAGLESNLQEVKDKLRQQDRTNYQALVRKIEGMQARIVENHGIEN